MRSYAFVHVDVFTRDRFGGNQLAVFTDGRGLSDAEMQAIAREMNFAESTFVLPPENGSHAARVRIFTTVRELPFAGHPTVGTAWVLARTSGAARVTLELGVGPIEVGVKVGDGAAGEATMRQRPPRFEASELAREDVARLLGLETAEIDGFAPLEIGSSGTPYLLVPVVSREAVDRARASTALGDAFASVPFHGIYVFARGGLDPAAVAHARMFHPGPGGIPQEDPATGSAVGPLGVYLVRHGLAAGDTFLVEQGHALGRPSQLHVTVESAGNEITGVQVGGGVVLVATGELVI